MDIKIQRMGTPNYVIAEIPAGRRQDGFTEAPKWHLRDVDAETLSILCDQFRADVFAKAGKPDPKAREGQ